MFDTLLINKYKKNSEKFLCDFQAVTVGLHLFVRTK
jgi:hypothetical protein